MVKKVWMLHLDNAQNYWETLGRMITEQPVAGGAEFDPSTDEESRTIASYERIFGAAPPAGIWAANAVPPGWLARLRGWFGSE